MQVFKTFMKIIKKNMHVSLIYIIIFIIIGFFMSSSSSKETNFKVSKLDISIIDEDNSASSKAISEFISKNHNVSTIENNKDIMLDSLYYRQSDVIITIHENFEERLAAGQTDALFSSYCVDGSYSAEFFNSELNQFISSAAAYVNGGFSAEDSCKKAAELAETEISVNTVSFSSNKEAGLSDSIGYYYKYLAYILISVIIITLCPTIIVMTQKEIGQRTNCSSMPVSKRMAQLVAGNAIFVIALYVLLTVAARIFFGSEMFSRFGLLALLNGFVFLLFSMTLTLLIAVLAPSKNTVNMIANVVGLGMSFLCGVFVPQELLSGVVLNIGKFLPAFWYVKANNMLSSFSAEVYSMNKYLLCIGIQLAFTATILCIALLVSKTKQRTKSMQ